MQILELFDYKQFVSYVVQMWYKEINNNSECNKKKKGGNNIKIEKETEVVIAMVSIIYSVTKNFLLWRRIYFQFLCCQGIVSHQHNHRVRVVAYNSVR